MLNRNRTPEEEAAVNRILETTNFYDLLEIPHSASIQDIKLAHNKLVVRVHPPSTSTCPRADDARFYDAVSAALTAAGKGRALISKDGICGV